MKKVLVSMFVVPAGAFVLGCQTDVPKDKMDAMAAWSTAICACAAKSGAAATTCAAATPKPTLEMTTSSGKPKYKLESAKLYGELETKGDMCAAKIR